MTGHEQRPKPSPTPAGDDASKILPFQPVKRPQGRHPPLQPPPERPTDPPSAA